MTELHTMPGRHGRLTASDMHRLTLQTKLTEFGIPPEPEDRGALRQLAELDEGSVEAVIRWLTCAADIAARATRARTGLCPATEAAPRREPAPEPVAAPAPTAAPASTPAPVPAPVPASIREQEPALDPRLLAW